MQIQNFRFQNVITYKAVSNQMDSNWKKTSAFVTEAELIKEWFLDLRTNNATYKEPFLSKDTVEFIKLVCEALKQDSHVFIMAVDIIEKYSLIKYHRKTDIPDTVLLIVLVIFLCNKIVAEQSDLKVKYIIAVYERLTSKQLSLSKIKTVEIEIIKALNYKLPLTSKIDHLKVCYEMYVKPMHLKVDFLCLCVEILQLVYINMLDLFLELKHCYKDNEFSLNAFQSIFSNNLYLPSGIILCAFQLTKYKNFIDLEKIELELSELVNIHCDHLQLLSKCITELVEMESHI